MDRLTWYTVRASGAVDVVYRQYIFVTLSNNFSLDWLLCVLVLTNRSLSTMEINLYLWARMSKLDIITFRAFGSLQFSQQDAPHPVTSVSYERYHTIIRISLNIYNKNIHKYICTTYIHAELCLQPGLAPRSLTLDKEAILVNILHKHTHTHTHTHTRRHDVPQVTTRLYECIYQLWWAFYCFLHIHCIYAFVSSLGAAKRKEILAYPLKKFA